MISIYQKYFTLTWALYLFIGRHFTHGVSCIYYSFLNWFLILIDDNPLSSNLKQRIKNAYSDLKRKNIVINMLLMTSQKSRINNYYHWSDKIESSHVLLSKNTTYHYFKNSTYFFGVDKFFNSQDRILWMFFHWKLVYLYISGFNRLIQYEIAYKQINRPRLITISLPLPSPRKGGKGVLIITICCLLVCSNPYQCTALNH